MHACSPSSFKSFLPVTSLFILSLTASGEAPAVSFTPLGGLPGGILFSLAEGVSADGSTVVGRGRLESIEGPEAFVWDATNGMRGLGDLPGGGFNSAARGVSADGSIVVGGGESASGNEAFVWDATNGMQSLQVLLTSLGIDLSGWQLSEARGVSADGKTIVGSGRNPSGQTEGFIAVIPEPSTALLMGLGLVGLGMMRSRVAAWHRDWPQTI